MEAKLPITIQQMDSIELHLALEVTNTVQFIIQRMSLADELQDFGLNPDINFIAALVDNSKVQ